MVTATSAEHLILIVEISATLVRRFFLILLVEETLLHSVHLLLG
jgi:hypothetical protein